MSIEPVQNKDILAYKSDCYVGMTAEEAKESGRSIFRDFKKIDNGDGVISYDEIVEQRDKKSKRNRIWGNISMGVGAYYCLNGLILENVNADILDNVVKSMKDSSGKVLSASNVKGRNLAWTLLFAGFGVYKAIKAHRIDKETQEQTKSYYGSINS